MTLLNDSILTILSLGTPLMNQEGKIILIIEKGYEMNSYFTRDFIYDFSIKYQCWILSIPLSFIQNFRKSHSGSCICDFITILSVTDDYKYVRGLQPDFTKSIRKSRFPCLKV